MTDNIPTPFRLSRTLAWTCLAALPMLGATRPAAAADASERIVAVVNDEAISLGDLEGRLKLAILAGNYPDNVEVREKLTPQVLRTLTDDQLRLQEAKRLKLKVETDEVNDNIKQLAEENHVSTDQFEMNLQKQGIPFSTLERQTMAQLAWSKVIQKAIRPRIDMSQDEIDAAYAKMEASVHRPQYFVAEIFLSVDKPEDDARVKAVADNLDDQLHHKGASFVKLAQQFSQSAGADKGGVIGWVQEGELQDPVDQAMRNLEPNQISAPIRTQAGYTILTVQQKGSVLAGNPAEAEVHLKNVLIPYTVTPTQLTMPQIIADAEKVRSQYPNCASIDEKGKRDGLGGDFGKPGEMMKIVDPRLHEFAGALASLQVNEISPPIPTQEGIMLFMVCARKDPPPREPPTKDQVANQLYMDRLDMLQQRYLSDLRSAALIDLRG